MKYLKVLALAASAALMFTGVAQAEEEVEKAEEAPAISFNWQNSNIKAATCLKQATASMEENEFSVLTRQTKSLVVGANEEYKATIICIPAKKMVFFVVSGADFGQAIKFTSALKKSF